MKGQPDERSTRWVKRVIADASEAAAREPTPAEYFAGKYPPGHSVHEAAEAFIAVWEAASSQPALVSNPYWREMRNRAYAIYEAAFEAHAEPGGRGRG